MWRKNDKYKNLRVDSLAVARMSCNTICWSLLCASSFPVIQWKDVYTIPILWENKLIHTLYTVKRVRFHNSPLRSRSYNNKIKHDIVIHMWLCRGDLVKGHICKHKCKYRILIKKTEMEWSESTITKHSFSTLNFGWCNFSTKIDIGTNKILKLILRMYIDDSAWKLVYQDRMPKKTETRECNSSVSSPKTIPLLIWDNFFLAIIMRTRGFQ